MSDANLFNSVGELRRMMQRLERGCDDTAKELRSRIAAQERSITTLGRFGAGVNGRDYMAARDHVVAVAAQSMNADRLETLMLRLEVEYVKRKARADRGKSSTRFDPFWLRFDAIVRRHTCRTSEAAYEKAAAESPVPHPSKGTAEKRYRTVMRGRC